MTMKLKQFQADLTAGKYDEKLCKLYGSSDAVLAAQRARYLQAAENFSRLYPEREEIAVFSAPGRTEIGGNHTDHQHGCVLAASVDLDVIAIVAFHDEHVIRLQSAGYPQDYVDLCDLTVQPEEKGKSAALIRGVVSRFQEMGVAVGGFDAYTTSNVLSGSGLSSSAAFEVLIGTIIDQHYHAGAAGAVEIAKIGQYAENRYFGKKSGLMDQMVSSVGGFVFIDFEDTDNPKIEKLSCQFEDAAHFYGDNRRAAEEAKALSSNDFPRFLKLVKESGDSSAKWLQNLYSCSKPAEQGITLGLWASKQILGDAGVSRVHGGGFAGTIQAFVPVHMAKDYCKKMDQLFGAGSCQILQIRNIGGMQFA